MSFSRLVVVYKVLMIELTLKLTEDFLVRANLVFILFSIFIVIINLTIF